MSHDLTPLGDRPEQPTGLRPVRIVSGVLATLAGVAIVVLMMLTVVDVFKRKLFGQGLTFTPEVTEVALVAVVFLGMMAAQFSGAHVRTPVVTERLKGQWQPGVRLIGLLAATFLAAWMTVVTLDYGLESLQTGEFRFGLARVPVWPAKLAIPIGAAGLTVALLAGTVWEARRLVTSRAGARAAGQDDPPARPGS